jgi:hypothetical protein
LDASGLRDAARLALIVSDHEAGTFRADASAALFRVAALAEIHAFMDIEDFQYGS